MFILHLFLVYTLHSIYPYNFPAESVRKTLKRKEPSRINTTCAYVTRSLCLNNKDTDRADRAGTADKRDRLGKVLVLMLDQRSFQVLDLLMPVQKSGRCFHLVLYYMAEYMPFYHLHV